MNVGEFIRKLRDQRGLTQRALAVACNMSTQTWQRQEGSARAVWTSTNARAAMLALNAYEQLTASEMQVFVDLWRLDPADARRDPPIGYEGIGKAMMQRFIRDPRHTARHVIAAATHLMKNGVLPGEIYATLIILGGKHGIMPVDDDEITDALQLFSYEDIDGQTWQIRLIEPTRPATSIPPPATTRPAASA